MKITVMTMALALAGMPLMFAAQTPAPATSGDTKPAATATAKTTKKHSKRVVKKSVKTPAAKTSAAPVAPAK